MKLFFNISRRILSTTFLTTIIYGLVLLLSVYLHNSNSRIEHLISPYIIGSDVVDFFLGIIISIPFAIHTYFLKKNNLLTYVQVRISRKKYLFVHRLALITQCFLMVFLVNVSGIVFSTLIAKPVEDGVVQTLEPYILGDMQMNNPILFSLLWALQKATLASLICLFAQIIALYIDNFFLAMLIPFVYIQLENFILAVLGLEKFSLTTALVLNRLSPEVMSVSNICISVGMFILLTVLVNKGLKYYGKAA